MQLTTQAFPKFTNQTEAGELISIWLGGGLHLAIVLARENSYIVIGVVKGFDSNSYAFHIELQGGGKCLSYGKEWLLEPFVGPHSWPGNQEFYDTPGVLHMTPKGCLINFSPRPEDRRYSALSFNLKDNTIDQVDTNSGVPVLSWKIWESAAVRDRKESEPLAQFAFKTPDGRAG